MQKKLLLISFLIFKTVAAQETIGLVYNDKNKEKSEGYTLFTATSDDRVYLINNCGEVVNQWSGDGGAEAKSRMVYLLENGNLLVGSGLNVEIRDWDDNILWGINYRDVLGFRIHHDIEPLPNGNILMLVKDRYTNTEMFAEGMNTLYASDVLILEKIVEIQPIGNDSAKIVWEWKLFDHLVQDFDDTKPNYGSVSGSPQLLDLNFSNGNESDMIHANAINYNADLDQIALSARHLNEVFVIDHSTSTSEAAGHNGGKYGKGGDFLWRWGNPEVYQKGTSADKKLGRQHDIRWISDGPYKGKMSVFSNDGYGSTILESSIHIIDQNDTDGVYKLSSGKYLPNDYLWSYDGTIMGEIMGGDAQCGVQIMANGNALINETNRGRISEVDGSGNLVWVYEIPVADNAAFKQFEDPIGNGAFRATRYPVDYPAFKDKSLTSSGIIEDENSISADCSNSLSLDNPLSRQLGVYPNPTVDIVNFDLDKPIDEILVYNLSGSLIKRETNSEFIDISDLETGLYFIKVTVDNNSQFVKILKN